MKHMKIPDEIQTKVIHFMKTTQHSLDQQKELDAFLAMISPSLRKDVVKVTFASIINQNEMFNNSDESESLILSVVSNLHSLLFLPEDMIV